MIDQAFQNMPYLISLNKKHIPFPSNFQLPFLQQNMALFQKITNLQSEFSNDQSIIAENKSIQASKLGGASFLRFPPSIFLIRIHKILKIHFRCKNYRKY